MISRTRLSRFQRATLKSWEGPGDEASVLVFYSTKLEMAAVFSRVIIFSPFLLPSIINFRRAQQFYLQVSAWMIRMESDLNTTAGAKTSAQALQDGHQCLCSPLSTGIGLIEKY